MSHHHPVAFLLFLLLLSTVHAPPVVSAARASAAASATTPAREAGGYVVLTLPAGRKRHAFRGREAEGCMPRGFRPPPSAPSRYANYHTLGSVMCSPEGKKNP